VDRPDGDRFIEVRGIADRKIEVRLDLTVIGRKDRIALVARC
jgi:hypothetical protein